MQNEIRLISVAIRVSSGSRKKFKIRVISGGTQLEVVYLWPEVLTDVNFLHRRWLGPDDAANKIQGWYPLILGFRNFFRQFRHKESDKITSFAHISLNCTVETNLHTKPLHLSWKINKGYRILYVTMRCVKDDYADVSECGSVEA